MRIIGVIPARMGSTRFPAKIIADIGGKPMIQHVWEAARKAETISEIFVATDHVKIYNIVRDFGGNAVMTGLRHKSGTDRIAEAVRGLKADIVVNIQGDEPLIRADALDEAVLPFYRDKTLQMSTLVCKVTDRKMMEDPNIVKVALDKDGFALYFSRSPLPSQARAENFDFFYKHIGVYVYKKNYLLKYVKMPQSRLEKTEKLEQLRALENGCRIKAVVTKYDTVPVDTPEDLKKVLKVLRS